jgi:L-threonylcarbamoyladenylate synthase
MKVIKEQSANATKIAAQALKNNQIICFATETVYALACDASSDIAVARLYEIKKRDTKKPIAVFVKDLAAAQKLLSFNATEKKIAANFMPGMITLVLNKKDGTNISPLLNNNENSLGLRIPNHQFCLELLAAFDGTIAATSANISDQKEATSFLEAAEYFEDKIDLIIDGGICQHKIASTVLRCENNQINILRQGLITKNQINNLL